MQEKSLSEINERIRNGSARVVTAEEMPDSWMSWARRERCVRWMSSPQVPSAPCALLGFFLNLGHSDPPIKIARAYLNRVEAYGGIAAVDLFLGATQPSEDRGSSMAGRMLWRTW